MGISNRGVPAIIDVVIDMNMKPRFILAILSTLIEEIAIAVIVLWGLPSLGVQLPLGGVIGIMSGLAVYAVFSYRLGSRALMQKPIIGLPDMVGSRGEVVKPLAPQGVIRISSELWEAKSASRKIDMGKEVIVVGQDGLKLTVRKSDYGNARGN